jgi:hypothetical protein
MAKLQGRKLLDVNLLILRELGSPTESREARQCVRKIFDAGEFLFVIGDEDWLRQK